MVHSGVRWLAMTLVLGSLALGQLPVVAQDRGTAAPAALPPVPNADPWFGVVQAVSAPQVAHDAGARWTRLIFPWAEMQPTGPGELGQGYFSDAQLEAQRAQGIELVGIALYTPTWAARDPQYETRSVPRNLSLSVDDP